jgi:hypothetical protein
MNLAARLTEWPPALSLLLISSLVVGFSWIGARFRRRWVPQEALESNLKVSEVIFNCIGMLYALLLAFMVVDVWDEYNLAKTIADQETSSLVSVTRLAHSCPATPPVRALENAVGAYAESVITREFPAMARMRHSEETNQAMERLWEAAGALNPEGVQEANTHRAIMTQMVAIQSARTNRVLTAARGMPGVLWAAMLGLTGIILGFSLLFPGKGFWVDRFMATSMALAVGLVIFIIVQLNYPFIGAVTIPTDGFEQAKRCGQGYACPLELLK